MSKQVLPTAPSPTTTHLPQAIGVSTLHLPYRARSPSTTLNTFLARCVLHGLKLQPQMGDLALHLVFLLFVVKYENRREATYFIVATTIMAAKHTSFASDYLPFLLPANSLFHVPAPLVALLMARVSRESAARESSCKPDNISRSVRSR
jgi:hypothetical protein